MREKDQLSRQAVLDIKLEKNSSWTDAKLLLSKQKKPIFLCFYIMIVFRHW